MKTYFESPEELETMLVRASKAHHDYEQTTGKPDPDWASWYARWIFANNVIDARPLATYARPLTLEDM